MYLLKLSLSMALVYLFYQLLLRRLTFYSWNRWYLLGYSFLAFLMPFINITPIVEKVSDATPVMIRFIPAIGPSTAERWHFAPGPWDLFFGLLALGALFLLVRGMARWLSLRKFRKGATLSLNGGVKIYQVESPIAPFSFGSSIYINEHLHTQQEWEEIILHEYVHIRQRHSVDILVAELFCALNWYNPFAWLMRHAIRQNLEFIADQEVLSNGRDKKSYQYHLLKVVGEPRYRLATNFNFSSLKKRIIMMNRSRSARLHLLRFLFILPLLVVLLAAFRDKVISSVKAPVRPPVVLHGSPVLPDGLAEGPLSQEVRPTRRPGAEKNSPAGKDTLPRPRIVKDTALIPASLMITDIHNPAHSPLFIIDGTPVDSSILKQLDPIDISSMEVLKDASATAIYGPKATYGVILITTKRKAWQLRKDTLGLILPDSSIGVTQTFPPGKKPASMAWQPKPVRFKAPWEALDLNKALYFIDGGPASLEQAKKLPPADVEYLSILTGPRALEAYGEDGKYGVIALRTKGSRSPVPSGELGWTTNKIDASGLKLNW